MELPGERMEQRPAIISERGLESGRRVEGVGQLQELHGVEAAAADRAFDRRADVVGRSDTDAGTFREERPGLIGLVEATGDEDRVALGEQGVGEAT